MAPVEAARARPRIPRGLDRARPTLFSYGFRPFFLGAGVMAVAACIQNASGSACQLT